jgi:hypothetical protein
MRTEDNIWVLPDMSREQALQIREWRTQGTWRWVAERIHENLYQGIPHGHQIAGEHLCRQAANLLGEDPNQEPWNYSFATARARFST